MKWLLGLFVLLLSMNAFAAYVPYVPVVYEDTTNYNELGGCVPPIQFAQEHGCTLKKDGRYSVNSYSCGEFLFDANCDGAVYNLQVSQVSLMFNSYWGLFVGIFLIVVVVMLAVIITSPFRKSYPGNGVM